MRNLLLTLLVLAIVYKASSFSHLRRDQGDCVNDALTCFEAITGGRATKEATCRAYNIDCKQYRTYRKYNGKCADPYSETMDRIMNMYKDIC